MRGGRGPRAQHGGEALTNDEREQHVLGPAQDKVSDSRSSLPRYWPFFKLDARRQAGVLRAYVSPFNVEMFSLNVEVNIDVSAPLSTHPRAFPLGGVTTVLSRW